MPSKSQNKATTKYVSENYNRIEVRFRKEENMVLKIKTHLKEYGYSDRSDFIKKAVETQMAIDRGELKVVKADEK